MSCTCRRHAVCPEHLGMLDPPVTDSWTVVDLWWTAHPVRREYREVRTQLGLLRVERRVDGGPWEEYCTHVFGPQARNS